MPRSIDIHEHVPGLTGDAVAGAPRQNLAIQDEHDVKHLKYRFDARTGAVFCLVQAPGRDTAIRVHRQAHDPIADGIIEVAEGS